MDMTLWINIVFAWIALVLTFFSVIIWVLRLAGKKKKIPLLSAVNRWLRRRHKLIGILLIAAGAVHGLFSSDALFSLNLGTVTWIVSILLGINWLFYKKLKKTWMTLHRLLTVAFVALLVIHILDVGGFILDDMIAGRITASDAVVQQTEQEPSVSASEDAHAATSSGDSETAQTASLAPETTASQTTGSLVYIDGTYQGTGTGFRPGLVVEVVIQDGKIASVTVVDHNEHNQRYWGYPVVAIPEAIVAAQSTDVDSISGATMTSEGIKEAVGDALSQALAG